MHIPKEVKLSEILDEIARGSNLDQALHLIAQKATVDLKALSCKIWVVKHGDICERCPLAGVCTNRQMCLHLAAASGAVMEREYPRIPLSVLNTSLIVRGGISDFRDNNGAGDKLFGIQKSAYTTGTPSYALYPLKGLSGTVGLIGVFNDRLIDQDELQILAQLAPAAVAAIRVAELLARCDALRYQLENEAPPAATAPAAEAPDGERLAALQESEQHLRDEVRRLDAECQSLWREKHEAEAASKQRLRELEGENQALKEKLDALLLPPLASDPETAGRAAATAQAQANEAAPAQSAAGSSTRSGNAVFETAAATREDISPDSSPDNSPDSSKDIAPDISPDLAIISAALESRMQENLALSDMHQQLESQLSLLEETNAELRDYNTALVENVENLESALRLAEDERRRCEEQRLRLEDEVANLSETVVRLRAGESRAEQEHELLADENERLREETTRLHKAEDELVREHERVIELEARLQDAQRDLVRLPLLEQESLELREANSKLEEAIAQFDALVPRLEDSLTNLRNRTELSERLCEEMEQRNRVLAEENRHLATREHTEARLLASLSHELRTPMNSISGFTAVLLDDATLSLGERQRHNLERIARNARDMTEFLNQVLDYSKIEAGRMDVYAEPLNLGEVINRAAEVAEGLKGNRPVTIRTEIEEDLPVIQSDRIKLQQILLNLLSNAVKFVDRGTVTISASRAGHEHLRISVSDTGIGIAESELSKIFEEFYQVKGGARSGAGLGLAITRRLVVLLEGEIAVSSRVGEGTVFVVTLPLQIESREAPSVARETPQIDPQRTALVIAEDAAMLYLTRRYLTEDGYSVATVEDAARGVEFIRLAKPSVIIFDIGELGELAGRDAEPGAALDAVNQLASRKGDGRLLVCAADVRVERDAMQAGADGFLRTPLERRELLAALGSEVTEKPKAYSLPYILVVDDDADTQEIVREMLAGLDYQVQTVADGKEALLRVAEHRPAAMILDLMLPEMDGFEVTHRLRLNPAWRDIPVILLTARDLSNEERKALLHGDTRVLQKGSFTRDDLRREVQAVGSSR